MEQLALYKKRKWQRNRNDNDAYLEDINPVIEKVNEVITALEGIAEATYQGVLDCDGGVDYPVASVGQYWRVSVAGIIGTAPVEVGDQVICIEDYAGGADDTKFMIVQKNMQIVWEPGTGSKSAQTLGNDNNASGDSSVAEGSETEASGAYSHAEGSATEASGAASHAEGISSLAHLKGMHAKSSGKVSGETDLGVMQYGNLTAVAKTLDATLTTLLVNDENLIVLPNDTFVTGRVMVLAVNAANGDVSSWEGTFTAKNRGGTTSLVSEGVGGVSNEIGGGITMEISVDAPSNSLVILVTGVAATTIFWNAVVEWNEIQYNVS